MKRKYLPELAAGNLVGCFGLTEANHGSDPGGMETTATFDAGTNEFVLNGSKNYLNILEMSFTSSLSIDLN